MSGVPGRLAEMAIAKLPSAAGSMGRECTNPSFELNWRISRYATGRCVLLRRASRKAPVLTESATLPRTDVSVINTTASPPQAKSCTLPVPPPLFLSP